MDKVLKFSKRLITEIVDKNSICVDATCGNGYDTLFLAQSACKKVFAFDIQEKAITNTKKILQENSLLEKCTVILDSHENFNNYIQEKIMCVVFNLGYLPNANHTITTKKDATLSAILKFLDFLEVGGRIIITVYPGHNEGMAEKKLLLEKLSLLNQKQVEVLKYEFINQKNNPPFILALEKRKDA